MARQLGGSARTTQQVNAGLDGCAHYTVQLGNDDVWRCERCAQRFGPIFTEQPRRNGDPTIKEVFGAR